MKINKTYFKFIVVLTLSFVTISQFSCDKLDKNGDLDGNWQLVEWRDNATDTVLTSFQKSLYYTVKLDLIQFLQIGDNNLPCISYFKHHGDSLIITQAFQTKSNSDSLVTIDYLKKYGVSEDGKFIIKCLNKNNMILSNSNNTLTFRKY